MKWVLFNDTKPQYKQLILFKINKDSLPVIGYLSNDDSGDFIKTEYGFRLIEKDSYWFDLNSIKF